MNARKRTTKRQKPEHSTIYSDGMGGEIRWVFAVEAYEALLDGQRIGFPHCEADGIELISQARHDVAGVRLH